MALFMLSRNLADKHLFTFHDDRGEVVLTSRFFDDRSAAEAGVEGVRAAVRIEGNVRCVPGTDGRYGFVVLGDDGEVLAVSARFSDGHACDDAIRCLRESAPPARLAYSRRA